MIISASHRTDIPAFYGSWFRKRLDAGYCKMVNPYGGQVYRVGLGRDEVDGFVFWTRNLGPFLDTLAVADERDYPFVVQYTITGYPRALEFSVVDDERALSHMQLLAAQYGPRAAVWRYDPILFTSLTSLEFHRRTFARLARALEGVTDEVVISFAHIYRKSRRNLDRAADVPGFVWDDPDGGVKRTLAAELAQVAQAHGMQLTLCSQRTFLAPGVTESRCVDAERLSDVAGEPIVARLKGNRPDCLCYQSRDIGAYDTCPHGCVYCYAVQNRDAARRRYAAHDPEGEFLFSPQPAINSAVHSALQERSSE
ncbi:MAG: DNA repair photolyase [Dehalococcoidia bacterium]|nr:DNA repair photolyase [Dehalococcoidia bacterium]